MRRNKTKIIIVQKGVNSSVYSIETNTKTFLFVCKKNRPAWFVTVMIKVMLKCQNIAGLVLIDIEEGG